MMIRLHSAAAPIVAALLLAGCATTMAPPPIALTEFGAVDCVTSPDLLNAISLLPEKDRAVWVVDRVLDGRSSCLNWEGSSGPYLVFALPAPLPGEAWGAPVEIGGVLEPLRLFSPHVVLLDSQGVPTRTFEPDQYLVRSSIYSVQFQPQPGESYALVTSNPARMGSAYEGIRTGTSTSYIYTGFGAMAWTTGVEQSVSTRFSYAGMVRALVYRPPEAEDEG